MRYRLFLRAALAVLVLAVIILVVGPAHAQSVPAPAADSGVIAAILTAVLAALPGLVLGGWALFKAYAAKSAAMWDDEAVAFVEKLAKGVVDAQSGSATSAKTAPVTGVDH